MTLDSGNHLLVEAEPAWQRFQSVVGEFLGWDGARSAELTTQQPDAALAPAHASTAPSEI